MSDLSYKRLSENSSEERRSSENMGFGREDGVRGPRRRSEMRVEIEVSEMRRVVMVRTDRMSEGDGEDDDGEDDEDGDEYDGEDEDEDGDDEGDT